MPRSPSWVLPNAKFDLDFENGRYWGGNVSIGNALTTGAVGDLFTADNLIQNAFAPDRLGILRPFPQYACRITDGLGLWGEVGNTNYCLWSRDFTNAAWVKTSVTATKNQAGMDLAANAASTLTASGTNATILQAITQASASFMVSAYIKRLGGTGTINMTVDGGTTWTDITSQIGSSGYLRAYIAAQTLANPSFGFQIATSGDSIAVDFFQCEQGANVNVPSTPMSTTSTTSVRANEHISAYSTGAHPINGQRILKDVFNGGRPFSFYVKYSGNPKGGGGLTYGSDATGCPMGIANGGADGSGALYSGQATPNVGNIGIGNWNKQAGRTNGFGSVGCLNGGAFSAYNTAANGKPQVTASTHSSLGNNGSGTTGLPMNGVIARFAVWDNEITDGQLIEFTRL